eukprot:symbB.v1.2.020162.t1/scaffold1649.1/size108312/5
MPCASSSFGSRTEVFATLASMRSSDCSKRFEQLQPPLVHAVNVHRLKSPRRPSLWPFHRHLESLVSLALLQRCSECRDV